ncbi:MAG: arylsulfatase [Opitutaceae bacterium]|jgi:arylsulfatase A-like enzyme|nr:arylsulfatase [Opitutaceae bacterium]
MRATTPTARPNLVYILADDMGYGDLSCLNPESRIRTPHLDALAAGGMAFRDAHSSSAVCTPSRYSILTGRYCWRSWLKESVTWGDSPALIEPGRMTIASLLRDHGYATACVGKWHLGWEWPWLDREAGRIDWAQPIRQGPLDHGFDRFFGIAASLDMPPYVYVEQDRVTAAPDRVVPESPRPAYWRAGETGADFRHEEVLDRITEEGIAFIERSAATNQPFFLYLPLTAPHTPISPSERFRGASRTNAYGDFCLEVDDVVGRIDATLRRLGLADDTIVVFTSDNGCSPEADFPALAALGHHPSHVFRGHKADIYEGGHRVPLLVRWPRVIAPGAACDETVCLIDLLATCADLLGVALPSDAGEDSVSNLPVWRGRALDRSLREATVHHSIDGSFSLRRGRWKLELCPGSGGWSSPRPGPECAGLPPLQLYDLEADIGERRNVAAEHPEVVRELTELLTRYVLEGRSTPGPAQKNHKGQLWKQLWWLSDRRVDSSGKQG